MPEKDVVEQLNFFEKKVLKALHELKSTSPEDILRKSGLSQLVEVMNASSWLQAKGLVKIEESITKHYSLRKTEVLSRPLPEKVAVEVLLRHHNGKGSMADLKKSGKLKDDEISIALGWIRKKGWGDISKDGKDTVITLTEKGKLALQEKGDDEHVIERLAKGPLSEHDIPSDVLEQLRSRKDILNERHATSRTIALTKEGAAVAALDLKMKEEVAQLTPELIQTGRWRDVEVRKYDVKAFAPSVYGGRLHPMTMLIEKCRDAFLKMGFKEIAGQYVESAFWNMDVLFTAQDHPAREMQDTFYIEDPERIDLSKDERLVEIVKQVHENGWKTGSQGWRYKWSRAEAERALLRTHTTVDTIRYIAQNPEEPFKVFSIGRIFRNEAMDSTHLPEFTQIEGIVCEKGSNFDMLCGLLKEFYKRMGIPKMRLRPGYFPYTEPSVEVEIYCNDKWMELGGAGVFRPEVTAPYGVEEP
ncbi:MAG TPA: phenylalanine--tRNA ligase subunit alpha, partial [Thermoplasmata archaeon]|nr:phenylalanine--tRNA ligase subunit alpha [Thermoplasmata archaeon]